jgi:serine/threonine-protein kinase
VTADLRTQLQDALGDAYTVERELGGGGMSRVFAAVETALGRRVVLKVLAPELGPGLSARRFAREIRLAASLQQANIVPVLSAGDMNGLPYYVMPFVDGLSLLERLSRDRRVAPATAIGILRDVARALAYAHEHGVVHRDIKPANVLLSGDAAVVTDFGIPRGISAARGEDTTDTGATTTFTLAGTALGTPAYMAPEQIVGEPSVDQRADIYSFGCLAYELLAGEPPFAGRTAQQLLAAHLGETPVPLGEKAPDCAPAIVRLVMHCLAKEPDARPQSARDLLTALESAVTPATGLDRLRNRFSWTGRRTVAAAAALTLIAVGAVAARSWLGAGVVAVPVQSLAVIPFTSVGGDTAQDYLAEGMADELTTALGRIAGLRVVSRTLSSRYRGRSELDATEIGRALAVGHLLQGTVRMSEGRLRVSAQLISATDNSEAWSEDFVRDDPFAVQDSIMRAVSRTLRGSALPDLASSGSGPATSGTRNAQAYDLYLRGKLLLERRGPGVTQAVERFEQAIALDSNFARAHAGLAVALELLPYFSPARPIEVRDRAIRAARRALGLDSTQAEAYTALGLAHGHAYEWEQGLAAHRRAVTLDSGDAGARVQYGRLLLYTGRLAESKVQFDRARVLDPYSAVASGWAGLLLSLTGRNPEAIVELHRALELDSLNPPSLFMMAQAFLQAGQRDSAMIFADRLARRVPSWRSASAFLYGVLGERAIAESTLRSLEAGVPAASERWTSIATVALSLRDTARALDAFERATAAGEAWPTWSTVSGREFDVLRGSARFAALLRRVGLDERVLNSPGGGRPR